MVAVQAKPVTTRKHPSSDRSWRRRLAAVVPVAALAAGLMALGTASPASAALPKVPQVTNGRAVAITVINGEVFVGGTFTSVTQNGTAFPRTGLFGYDLATGALDTAFNPVLAGGTVTALATAPGGGLLVGGSFATVNGTSQPRLARLNLPGGALNPTFKPAVNSSISRIAVAPTRVFIGGTFATVGGLARPRLAEVNPITGAVVAGFNQSITGNAAVGGFVTVQGLAVSPDGNRLVVAHNGTMVGGQERYGVAVIDLAGGGATLNPWFTGLWKDNLFRNGGVVRVTNVAWGPTGTWFVTTNTGGDRPPTNDSVQRFDVTGVGPKDPTWITRQFDSSYSVDVGPDGTIYAGGHFRFTEAPGSTDPWPGDDNVNYGFGPAGGAVVLGSEVVERGQLDALDPVTGKALNWYHTANGQHGITALEVVGDALLIGQDGNLVDGVTVGKHGIVPAYTAQSDGSKPLSTVAEPLKGAVTPVGATVVTGHATAPNGVQAVVVEVKKGTQWVRADGTLSPTFVGLPTTLTAPNTAATDWSVTVPLTGAGAYQIFPKTTDLTNVKEPLRYTVPVTAIDLSNSPPGVVINTPTPNEQDFPNNNITVSGTATDTDGVAAVQVSFFNVTQQGYVQADGVTIGDFVTFPAVLGTATGSTRPWSLTMHIPDGEYNVFVNAVDTKGAALPRSLSQAFVMSPGNPAPVTTISTPAQGATIGSSLTITGTATDNTSVRRVLVRMSDGRFGLGPQVGGGFGQPGLLPASLSGPPGAASTTWSLTVTGLPIGTYSITAYAEDAAGIATATVDRPTVSALQQRPTGFRTPEPGTSISGPNPTTFRATTLQVPLTGAASYVGGVSGLKVAAKDLLSGQYLQPDGTTSGSIAFLNQPVTNPGTANTPWGFTLALPNPSQWQIDVIAVGQDGNLDWSSLGGRSTFFVYPGDADPFLGSATGTPGSPGSPSATSSGGQISTGGRAFDDIAVTAVQVMVRTSTTSGLRSDGSIGTPQWLTAFVTNPGGTFTNFNYLSPVLPNGTWTLLIRAVDSVGKPTVAPFQATLTVP
jgi:trimeric autotransporter adhesin